MAADPPAAPSPRPAAGDGQAAPAPVPARRLFGLARPYLRPLLAATLLMVAGSAIGLLAPAVAGRVVDAALVDADPARLNRVVLTLLVLFAILGGIAYLEHVLLRQTGARLLLDLRQRLFDHLMSLSPEFYEIRSSGELLSRMGSDLTVVQQAITHQIPNGIQAVLRFAGTLIVLLVLQTRLTLVALSVVPPVALVAVYYGRRIERLARGERDTTAAAGARAEESLGGIRTVQAFQHEDGERAAYAERLRALLDVQLRNARVEGAFAGLVQFAAFSAFAVVLWYGGRLMLTGALTPGQLTSFLLYTFSIAVSVGTLGALYAAFRELRGASARIFELLDTRSSIEDAPDAIGLPEVRGDLGLRGVRFSYPSDPTRFALDGVTLRIRPGEVVGLVGPSGSGKSTLFSLLLRFHDPTVGEVTLDGHDLRRIRLQDLRGAIGLVPQEIFLFSGSIEDNLRVGAPEARRDALIEALQRAGAWEFVERLPAGMDSLVGPRGVRLSAGQRQRLAIARAFLRDPRILLLDEATSSLDPDSEQRVQEALETLMRGRTTVVIAHRLATARKADRIVLLERGRVVGEGDHDTLYEQSELYRRYWTLQSLSAEA